MSAAEQPWMPEASGYRSSGTLAKNMAPHRFIPVVVVISGFCHAYAAPESKSSPSPTPTIKSYTGGWGKGSSSSHDPVSILDSFKGKSIPENGNIEKPIQSVFLSRDDRFVKVKLTNPNAYNIVFRGRQYKEDTTIKQIIKTQENGEWKITGRDFCGTHVRDWSLPAGQSIDVLLVLGLGPAGKKEQVWALFYKEDDPTIRSECILFEEK